MAPHSKQHTPHVQSTGMEAQVQSALTALSNHPRAVRGGLLALVVLAVAGFFALDVQARRARAQGQALVDAFAMRDGVLDDAAQSKGRVTDRAARPKDNDDDDDGGDDDARDDDDGDDDGESAQRALEAGLPHFPDRAARDAAARRAFLALAEGRPGGLGAVAALEAADLSAHDADQTAEVRTALQKNLAALQDADSLLPLLALREAALAEQAGDSAAAERALDRIVSSGLHFLGDEAQVRRARALMAQGDTEGARSALDAVLEGYPQSALQDEVRILTAALDAASDDAPAAAPSAGHSAG